MLQVDYRHAERIEIVGEPVMYMTRISRFRALVLDQFGQPLQDSNIRWSSSHPELAAVSAAGIVRAMTPGVTHIIAEAGGIRQRLA